MLFFFFFKQKTAYEMRISDWSSDVCSSDLRDDGSVEIHQQILVGRASQRTIVLGKGGQRLKEIGSKARAELASLLGVKVHLYQIGRASCRERVCQYV